jgi:two-component system, cell cycle sensor histidine kinase and response regulator CckA
VIQTFNQTVRETDARAQEVPPGHYVGLSVTDAGVGMDDATRTRAFEPFYTTKPVGEGTGLGLATVYGIVTQSEGFVTVDTAVGKGTTMTVLLPLARTPVELEEEPKVAPSSSNGASRNVLLVEDEDVVRRMAARMLERLGYRVVAAASGAAALAALKDNEPIDVLVTDLVMPGMSGVELARRFASEQPSAAVLFVSGYADADITHGLSRDGTPYLAKPFTRDELAEKLTEVLEAVAH